MSPRIEALAARVERILSRRMALDVPSPETDLFETGLLDSLTFVDLLVELEEEFSVSLDLDEVDLEAFRSVVRIAALVDERTRAGELTTALARAEARSWER